MGDGIRDLMTQREEEGGKKDVRVRRISTHTEQQQQQQHSPKG